MTTMATGTILQVSLHIVKASPPHHTLTSVELDTDAYHSTTNEILDKVVHSITSMIASEQGKSLKMFTHPTSAHPPIKGNAWTLAKRTETFNFNLEPATLPTVTVTVSTTLTTVPWWCDDKPCLETMASTTTSTSLRPLLQTFTYHWTATVPCNTSTPSPITSLRPITSPVSIAFSTPTYTLSLSRPTHNTSITSVKYSANTTLLAPTASSTYYSNDGLVDTAPHSLIWGCCYAFLVIQVVAFNS